MPVSHTFNEFALRPSWFLRPKPVSAAEAGKSPMPLQDLGLTLVEELARVGWDVPGIQVHIGTYGKGDNLLTVVRSISGRIQDPHSPFVVPYKLGFGGKQGLSSRWNISTAMNHALLPTGYKIDTHDDGSRGMEHWQGTENVDDPTFMKEYAEGWKRIDNAGVGSWQARIQEARNLAEAVVRHLQELPAAPGHDDIDEKGFDANLKRLLHVEPIPAPADFPTLYVWDKDDGLGRAGGRGHRTPENPEDDYVVAGNGWRLVPFGNARGPLPERATDGFSYASADPNRKAVGPGWSPSDEMLPAEVKLKHLNEIFVVDGAAYENERKAIDAECDAARRDHYTKDELNRPYGAVARTMVAAADYRGQYAEPMYLIGRQLHADEARIMAGPIRVVAAEGKVSTTMLDQETGLDLQLMPPEEIFRGSVMSAQRVASRASYVLMVPTREVGIPKFDEPALLHS